MKKFIPTLREHKLSPQQWRVIRVLVEVDQLDVTALAEQCYLLMPSLSRIIQHLERRGLVKRARVAGDQRRFAISITEQGRELFAAIAPVSEGRYQYITERFGYGKLELLYELLEELIEKLDEEADSNACEASERVARPDR